MAPLNCPSCQRKLQVPEAARGRKIKCPACATVFTALAAAAPSPPPPKRPTAARPASHPSARSSARRPAAATDGEEPEEVRNADDFTSDFEVIEEAPPSRASKKSSRSEADTAPPPRAKKSRPKDDVEDEEPPDDEAEEPRKKKKKKKKKKKQLDDEAPAGIRPWMWWAGGAALYCTIAFVTAFIFIENGHGADVTMVVVQSAFLLPFEIVILIISMIISNQLFGGMDFGEVHVVIGKSLALLLIVTPINLLPFPFDFMIGTLVWLFGLMFLFHLTMGEACFLDVVNWALTYLIKLFLLAVLVSAVMHGGGGGMGGVPGEPKFQGKQLDLEEP